MNISLKIVQNQLRKVINLRKNWTNLDHLSDRFESVEKNQNNN